METSITMTYDFNITRKKCFIFSGSFQEIKLLSETCFQLDQTCFHETFTQTSFNLFPNTIFNPLMLGGNKKVAHT